MAGSNALLLHGLQELQGWARLLGTLAGSEEGVVDVQGHGRCCPLHARPHPHRLRPMPFQTA